jgi:hypothetical protein
VFAETCTRDARTILRFWYSWKTFSNWPSKASAQAPRQTASLHRHRGALRHVLEHEVRRVAEQR